MRGNPSQWRRWTAPAKVYPRLCGGTAIRPPPELPSKGLSPPVRGNPFTDAERKEWERSIPACAGGTIARRGRRGVRRGLSPPVRGNRQHQATVRADGGSIPACAGEPIEIQPPQDKPEVYPRLCGGTPPVRYAACLSRGLSPPVRGNRRQQPVERGCVGSIPACAGEPSAGCGGGLFDWVYPRLCGGTSASGVPRTGSGGLSPPVRGNRRAALSHAIRLRSIPACAGEPVQDRRGRLSNPVYPRLCGGTGRSAAATIIKGGLSPPVRGNLLRRFRRGAG